MVCVLVPATVNVACVPAQFSASVGWVEMITPVFTVSVAQFVVVLPPQDDEETTH